MSEKAANSLAATAGVRGAEGAARMRVSMKEWIGRVLLAVWIVVTMLGLAALAVRHMGSLPEPNDEATLSRGMLELRRGSDQDFVVHVIYAECSCSRALFAHLIARRRFPGAEEAILFIGADARKQALAKRAGFAFTAVSATELLSRFGLESAPVLVVFNSMGQLRYVGGYYAHPATVAPLDEKVYAQLSAGADVAPLPVFGCAVSTRLQESLYPVSLGSFATLLGRQLF